MSDLIRLGIHILYYFLETKIVDISLYLRIHFVERKLGLGSHKFNYYDVINLSFIQIHIISTYCRHIINKKNVFMLLAAIDL